MSKNRVDVAIIGSGVIGLAIARGLLDLDPSLRIAIYERESNFGIHASSRNSGVLHAGFYYSPNSLKARFCQQGNVELRNVIDRHSIPILKTGKVVVAQDRHEEERLGSLVERGEDNGVVLEHLPAADLHRFEPLARTFGSFIWSPNTCVSNPVLVNRALEFELRERGVVFCSNSLVRVKENQWLANGDIINSKYFINAAGAWALNLANQVGVGLRFRTMPFLGLYVHSDRWGLPLKTLVYPVPHNINPFLGVHLTLTVDGRVKIGPSALPVIGKTQYKILSPVSRRETLDFLRNIVSITKGDKHELFEMMKYEIPKLSIRNLVKAASSLVPTAGDVSKWERMRPGIRGQLIDSVEGNLVQDFMVDHAENSTHVLNAVSPGWTASLPFGRHIALMAIERVNSLA